MDNAQMHTLERHTLDCNLCAEALMAYEQLPNDTDKTLAELSKKIDNRIAKNGWFFGKKNIFAIAASILVLLGGALLIYLLEDHLRQTQIAEIIEKEDKKNTSSDEKLETTSKNKKASKNLEPKTQKSEPIINDKFRTEKIEVVEEDIFFAEEVESEKEEVIEINTEEISGPPIRKMNNITLTYQTDPPNAGVTASAPGFDADIVNLDEIEVNKLSVPTDNYSDSHTSDASVSKESQQQEELAFVDEPMEQDVVETNSKPLPAKNKKRSKPSTSEGLNLELNVYAEEEAKRAEEDQSAQKAVKNELAQIATTEETSRKAADDVATNTSNNIEESLIGTYTNESTLENYVLKSNGQFEYANNNSKQNGVWEINGNLITLNFEKASSPSISFIPSNGNLEEIDLKNNKSGKVYKKQ